MAKHYQVIVVKEDGSEEVISELSCANGRKLVLIELDAQRTRKEK